MLVAVADTHAVVWYIENHPRLSVTARAVIEAAAADGENLGLTTIVLAEVLYLVEKGRLQPGSFQSVVAALDRPDGLFQELPFTRAVAEAMQLVAMDQVPDLPDRMIAATARLYAVPLISGDRKIRLSGLETIW